jgi:transposase
MAFLSIIRRCHLREHVPIREISRRTGVSRNTARKYLRAGTVEPKFKVPDRPSKLGPFSEQLMAWLKREAGRSRKQKGTIRQLYLDLVALASVAGMIRK